MSEILEKRADEKLGDFLVRAREAQGLSKEDLARNCGVSERYLEWIEAGDWKKFTVEAYLRSYVNSISVKLGLDSKAILTALSAEMGSNYEHEFDAANPSRDFEVSNHTSSSKSKIVILAVVVVAALAAFFIFSGLSSSAPEEQAPKVENISGNDSLTVAPNYDGAQKIDPVNETPVADKERPTSATTFISSDSKATASENVEAPKNLKSSKVELVVTGADSSWVGIAVKKDASGKPTFRPQKTLRKDVAPVTLTSKDTMFVQVANVSAVEMKINDASTKIPSSKFRVVNGKVLKGF